MHSKKKNTLCQLWHFLCLKILFKMCIFRICLVKQEKAIVKRRKLQKYIAENEFIASILKILQFEVIRLFRTSFPRAVTTVIKSPLVLVISAAMNPSSASGTQQFFFESYGFDWSWNALWLIAKMVIARWGSERKNSKRKCNDSSRKGASVSTFTSKFPNNF